MVRGSGNGREAAAGSGTSAQPQVGIMGHFLVGAKGLGLGKTAGQDVGEFAYFNRIVGEDAGDTFGRKDLLDVSRGME
jgi:hypothetical protein